MHPSPFPCDSGGPASLTSWGSLGALLCAGWLVPFVGLMVLGGVVVTPSFAQAPVAVDPSHYRVEFEDEHVRVLRVRLEPGREVMAHDHPDAVLVYFTADLHGRMPPAEAQWQPAGVHEPENAARTWFEAVLVELKQAAPQEAPPAAVAQEADPYWVGTRVTRLLDNAKVTVSKYRLAPMARGELRPYHLNEAVIVYLRGGYLVGSTGRFGPYRDYNDRPKVRRGQVEVLPANTPFGLASMGNDPIEFVEIQLK